LEHASKALRKFIKEIGGEIIMYADDMLLMFEKKRINELKKIVERMEYENQLE